MTPMALNGRLLSKFGSFYLPAPRDLRMFAMPRFRSRLKMALSRLHIDYGPAHDGGDMLRHVKALRPTMSVS